MIILLFSLLEKPKPKIGIIFDPHNSPPRNPPSNSSESVYNVPLNHIISRPLVATLQVDGVRVTSGELADVPFTLESVDVDVNKISGTIDLWERQGGKLCQWRHTTRPDDLK